MIANRFFRCLELRDHACVSKANARVECNSVLLQVKFIYPNTQRTIDWGDIPTVIACMRIFCLIDGAAFAKVLRLRLVGIRATNSRRGWSIVIGNIVEVIVVQLDTAMGCCCRSSEVCTERSMEGIRLLFLGKWLTVDWRCSRSSVQQFRRIVEVVERRVIVEIEFIVRVTEESTLVASLASRSFGLVGGVEEGIFPVLTVASTESVVAIGSVRVVLRVCIWNKSCLGRWGKGGLGFGWFRSRSWRWRFGFW